MRSYICMQVQTQEKGSCSYLAASEVKGVLQAASCRQDRDVAEWTVSSRHRARPTSLSSFHPLLPKRRRPRGQLTTTAMATSASVVSLLGLAHPLPANGTSLWRSPRGVGVAARAPAPARFAARAEHAHADADARRKRLTPRFFVGVRCVGVDGAEALRSDAAAEPSPSSVPRSVPVRVAYELQQAGHRYLDVRTEGEFGAGHPEGAVNIPYMYKTGSGMTKNTHFLEQVSRVLGKDDEIIVGCQSGKRSLMAATELCSAGFTAVTDIAGGFSTWRENELPITIQ